MKIEPEFSRPPRTRFPSLTVGLLLCGLLPLAAAAPVDPSSLAEKKSLVELMTRIAGNFIRNNPLAPGEYRRGDWNEVMKSRLPKTCYWSYTGGVSLLALQRVFAITGDEEIPRFIRDNNEISADQYSYLRWQQKTFGKIYKNGGFGKLWRLSMLDDCGAMGAEILETKLRGGATLTPAESGLIDIIGEYVTQKQSRLPDGAFWRPESPDGPTIWADDLFMGVPFLIRWSEDRKDPAVLDDAARQIVAYASRLQDRDGVWFHAYFVNEHRPNGIKWGRANGWVAVATAELLSVLPADHPRRPQILEIFQRQMEGLRRLQSPSGLWQQVLDHPELTWGLETSCSAQFAYAMARGLNRGWLDNSFRGVVHRAIAALCGQTTPDGRITNVCPSTSIGRNLEYYNTLVRKDNDPHGCGLMLLALTEAWAIKSQAGYVTGGAGVNHDDASMPAGPGSLADLRPARAPRTLTVAQAGGAGVVGGDSAVLQRAADALGAGDTLLIGPGTYRMDNSLKIPSGVTVRGTSGQTILRKQGGVESALTEDADFDENQLTVAEPRKFAPGMGITIMDDALKSDWDVTVSTVTGVEGKILRISPATVRDYEVERRHARVRNTFPILCAVQTQNVVIEDIVVDGNKAENAYLDGCRGGAIYVYQSKNITIKNCVARNYNGDGISFQNTEGTRILNCESSGNTGDGIHPGTGAVQALVKDCRIHENGQFGLFLCWRVKFGSFEDNEIAHNGSYGISIGHKDTDNLFVGNTVSGNGISGVYFRQETFQNSGHRNTFRSNIVMDNGSAGKGYGFYVEPHAGDLVLANNRIGDTRSGAGRTQRYGIYKARGAGRIELKGNSFEGDEQKSNFEDGSDGGSPQK